MEQRRAGKPNSRLQKPVGDITTHLFRSQLDLDAFLHLNRAKHRESERGKKQVEKFSSLPAGNKRLVLTHILYHISVCSFSLFSFSAELPSFSLILKFTFRSFVLSFFCSFVLSFSLFFFLSFFHSFCLSFFLSSFLPHTLCFFHLCSRQQIRKNWIPLNTHHLHAAVCVSSCSYILYV